MCSLYLVFWGLAWASCVALCCISSSLSLCVSHKNGLLLLLLFGACVQAGLGTSANYRSATRLACSGRASQTGKHARARVGFGGQRVRSVRAPTMPATAMGCATIRRECARASLAGTATAAVSSRRRGASKLAPSAALPSRTRALYLCLIPSTLLLFF